MLVWQMQGIEYNISSFIVPVFISEVSAKRDDRIEELESCSHGRRRRMLDFAKRKNARPSKIT
jgi:hypothetical protein